MYRPRSVGSMKWAPFSCIPAPPPSVIGHPSSQCCNRNSILGSRVGLLTVSAMPGGRSWGGLQIHRWRRGDLSRRRAGAVGTATSAGGRSGECRCPLGNRYSGREVLCLKFSCLSHFQLNWTNIIDLYWQYNLSCMLLLQSCIVQPHL